MSFYKEKWYKHPLKLMLLKCMFEKKICYLNYMYLNIHFLAPKQIFIIIDFRYLYCSANANKIQFSDYFFPPTSYDIQNRQLSKSGRFYILRWDEFIGSRRLVSVRDTYLLFYRCHVTLRYISIGPTSILVYTGSFQKIRL